LVGVLVCAKGGVLALVMRQVGLAADLGTAFMDDWVVGNERGCYWLSNDIVGLMGNLTV